MIATSKAGVDLLNNFKTTRKKLLTKKGLFTIKCKFILNRPSYSQKQSIYNKLKTHTKKNDLAMQCKSSTKKHFRYYSFTIFGFSRLLFR